MRKGERLVLMSSRHILQIFNLVLSNPSLEQLDQLLLLFSVNVLRKFVLANPDQIVPHVEKYSFK